jgi:hypothetical protein
VGCQVSGVGCGEQLNPSVRAKMIKITKIGAHLVVLGNKFPAKSDSKN